MKCISTYEQKMRTGKLLSVIYKNIRKNQIARKEPKKTRARLYTGSLPRMAVNGDTSHSRTGSLRIFKMLMLPK